MSLKRNAIWNLAGMGLPLLLGVVAIPYLYHHLGTEKIGILTLVWALIGYFSLFDFGLGRALTQQVSVARANDQTSTLPGLIKIGLLFTASTGLLGGIVMAIVSGRLGTTWLNVSAAMQQAAVAALLIAAVGIPMTTVTTGLRGVLEAYEEFASVNLLRIALGMSNFGLPMLSVLWFGPSLQWVIASLVGARCVLLIAHLMLINRKLPRGWYRTPLNIAQCRQLFSFGAWITVSNIIGPLMVTADRFIISAVLGASLVAYYSVPSDMLLRVLILPVALTAALFPRLASVMVIDPRAARQLYVRSLRLVALVMTPTCLAIAAGSYWGLFFWLGKDFAEHSWLVVAILSLGVLLNGIALVPYSVVQAAGHASITAKIHTVELLFYIPALFVSLHLFGLVGASFTWLVRVAVDLLALLFCARNYGFRQGGDVSVALTSRAT